MRAAVGPTHLAPWRAWPRTQGRPHEDRGYQELRHGPRPAPTRQQGRFAAFCSSENKQMDRACGLSNFRRMDPLKLGNFPSFATGLTSFFFSPQIWTFHSLHPAAEHRAFSTRPSFSLPVLLAVHLLHPACCSHGFCFMPTACAISSISRAKKRHHIRPRPHTIHTLGYYFYPLLEIHAACIDARKVLGAWRHTPHLLNECKLCFEIPRMMVTTCSNLLPRTSFSWHAVVRRGGSWHGFMPFRLSQA
jgi:hypothetical protein